jgi:predicted DNA-binding transcriptional regulator AlpA
MLNLRIRLQGNDDMKDGDALVTPEELGARYRTTLDTLYRWRATGTGPRFMRIGGRVYYPESAIEQFEKNRTFEAVSDYGVKS